MKKRKTSLLRLLSVLCIMALGLLLNPNKDSLHAATNDVQETIDGIEWLATVGTNGEVAVKPVNKSDIGIEVTIPEYVGDLKVTAISPGAFFYYTELETVHLPDSITSIGYNAFGSCYALKNINFPEHLTQIGYAAFHSTSLKTISIPDGVTEIQMETFQRCKKLEDITLPSTVTTIGNDAFKESSILSFNIPEKTTELGEGVFDDCKELDYIGVNPFNTTFTSLDGVLYNSDETELIRCPLTKSGTFTIQEGVTSIAAGAFEGCTNLTSIVFPESLKGIGDKAFVGCTGLHSMTISSNLAIFNETMIEGCTNLQEFTVSKENETFCSVDGILYNKKDATIVVCPKKYSGEINIPSWVEKIPDGIFYDCPLITKINISDSVVSMGTCFKNCYSLESISVGKSVASIDNTTFNQCLSLERIDVDPENETYCSVDGVLFSKDMKQLLRCPLKTRETYQVPAGVEVLECSCFTNCYQLRTLILPEGVKEVVMDAFGGYACITKLYFPKSLAKAYVRSLFWSKLEYTITVKEGTPDIKYVYNDYKFVTMYYAGTKADFSQIEVDAFSKYYHVMPGTIYYLEPSISTQPQSSSYSNGDVSIDYLTVAAQSGVDGSGKSIGDLSYQWYVSTDEDMKESTPIEGATECSYLPSIKKGNTLYYKCVVTNTLDDYAVNVSSKIAKVEVIGTEKPPVEDNGLSAVMNVNSDWQTGYNGEIVITNNSEQAIHNWSISFEMKDSIDNMWSGILKDKVDDMYTIESADYNGTILPGQSVSMGFIATKSGDKADIPANILVISE